VERGLVPTRARARDAILRGHVTVAGALADRPAQNVHDDADIRLDDPAAGYVSRAALKLAAALDRFGYSPEGRVALDVGASTGGFTQVLLERGARKVLAVDVGHGQLDPTLAADPRVVSREGLNARDLTAGDLGEPVEAIVADVSFISLKLVLPPALGLAADDAWGVFLVKPQFEVGRAALGKGGIVREAALAERTAAEIADWIATEVSWTVDGVVPSPIAGGDGNREFLIGARRG
jgi:23S rRNA (cytidine1920-2'-O)/16S rRNA (cytidine1409-2'-O)-methyltransferase